MLPLGSLLQNLAQFVEETQYAHDDGFILINLDTSGVQKGIEIIQPVNVWIFLLQFFNGHWIVQCCGIASFLIGQGDLCVFKEIRYRDSHS